MIASSCRVDRLWRGWGERPAVAQQRPQYVDEASGQGENSADVDQSFAAFVAVQGARGSAGFDAGQAV
ncbi:hypothetical protein H0B56_14525 [Haloechinothrix sp. YIM 98757]|uniref:Uncharacterized protein n=1 Tax=Haloechinothrix aidingensis TaxID=2752311 RepID=A0A838ABX3_9PSEU|nr:hypothetical protein [Haloechinothrix aidingensis]